MLKKSADLTAILPVPLDENFFASRERIIDILLLNRLAKVFALEYNTFELGTFKCKKYWTTVHKCA
jgi:hypothetical protein